jgi:hypothetical protein
MARAGHDAEMSRISPSDGRWMESGERLTLSRRRACAVRVSGYGGYFLFVCPLGRLGEQQLHVITAYALRCPQGVVRPKQRIVGALVSMTIDICQSTGKLAVHCACRSRALLLPLDKVLFLLFTPVAHQMALGIVKDGCKVIYAKTPGKVALACLVLQGLGYHFQKLVCSLAA